MGISIQNDKVIDAIQFTTLAGAATRRVSLKNYTRLSCIMHVFNGGGNVAGDLFAYQAKDIAGTDEKSLSMTSVWGTIDTDTNDDVIQVDASSGSFTTPAPDLIKSIYVIDIDSSQLDTSNGFDCVRFGGGVLGNCRINVSYVMSGARYPQKVPPSVIVD